jgi:hypothetical protein
MISFIKKSWRWLLASIGVIAGAIYAIIFLKKGKVEKELNIEINNPNKKKDKVDSNSLDNAINKLESD